MRDRYKVKIGTWNVNIIFNGRSRELAKVLKRRKVNFCCVKEIKRKGEKVKK
jgi:exonuclease III